MTSPDQAPLPDRAREALRLAGEATQGERHVDGFHTSAVIVRHAEQTWKWQRIAECDSDGFRNPNWYNDAQYIVAACNTLPDLAAAYLRMRSALEAAEKRVQFAFHRMPPRGNAFIGHNELCEFADDLRLALSDPGKDSAACTREAK